ncbi:glycosyltransferase family 2 protein [Bacillus cereus]
MKTSIIVLTHNKLEYTKLCVESINQFTRKGTYELIIVDNNSTDGTVEWLREQDDIKVIYNQENMGFPKGCNQGIVLAEGDNILLLNNDTIVTHNWLENLINVLYSSDEIGAVGPITNSCSYYQAIDVNYKSIEEMHEFSRNKNVINNDLWEERLKLIGFCMLIKKK